MTDAGHSYAVDSLVLLLQSVIAPQAYLEIGGKGYARALTIAAYTGMLVYESYYLLFDPSSHGSFRLLLSVS